MEVIVWIGAFALGLMALFAQFRLFGISDSCNEILKELRLIRLDRLHESGIITDEEYGRRVQEATGGTMKDSAFLRDE